MKIQEFPDNIKATLDRLLRGMDLFYEVINDANIYDMQIGVGVLKHGLEGFLKRILISVVLCLSGFGMSAQNNAIPIEAENANVIGSDFNTVIEGAVTYLTPKTDLAASTNPGTW